MGTWELTKVSDTQFKLSQCNKINTKVCFPDFTSFTRSDALNGTETSVYSFVCSPEADQSLNQRLWGGKRAAITCYLKASVLHGIAAKSNIKQRTLMGAEAGARANVKLLLYCATLWKFAAFITDQVMWDLQSISAIPLIKSKIPGSPQSDSWSALLQTVTPVPSCTSTEAEARVMQNVGTALPVTYVFSWKRVQPWVCMTSKGL